MQTADKAQLLLADEAVKKEIAVETLSGVIDKTFTAAKECIHEYMGHISMEDQADPDFVLKKLTGSL